MDEQQQPEEKQWVIREQARVSLDSIEYMKQVGVVNGYRHEVYKINDKRLMHVLRASDDSVVQCGTVNCEAPVEVQDDVRRRLEQGAEECKQENIDKRYDENRAVLDMARAKKKNGLQGKMKKNAL